MITLVILCVFVGLSIPLLVALMESNRSQLDSTDDGFWTLARALMGGCHIRWSPDPTPIVWFDIGLNQGRMHVYQRAGNSSWWLEGRVYLNAPLHFAARLCSPKQLSLKPSLPYLNSFIEQEGKPEDRLSKFSLETNNSTRFVQCLSMTELKVYFKQIRDHLKLNQCEILLLNQMLIIRGSCKGQEKPGEVIEKFGPQLSNMLRMVSQSLTDFSDKNRFIELHYNECAVSATDLKGELWSCSGCNTVIHRVAMEVIKGCCNPHCEKTIDGVSEELLFKSRPQLVIKEMTVEEGELPEWIQLNANTNND